MGDGCATVFEQHDTHVGDGSVWSWFLVSDSDQSSMAANYYTVLVHILYTGFHTMQRHTKN